MTDLSDTHVVPVDDVVKHDPVRQCLCRPTVTELVDGTTIVLHHSYDAREYAEADYEPAKPNA